MNIGSFRGVVMRPFGLLLLLFLFLLPLFNYIDAQTSAGKCGIEGIKNKIIGGNSVPVEKYPWYVALIPTNEFNRALQGVKSPLTVYCGGSLITTKHVLSAAHCFATLRQTGGNWKAKLVGVIGLSNRCTPSWKAYSSFSNVVIHQQYNSDTVKNDISLVYLAKEITGGTPVCFPSSGVGRKANVNTQTRVVYLILGTRAQQIVNAQNDTSTLADAPETSLIEKRALTTRRPQANYRHKGEVTVVGYGTTRENSNKTPCSLLEATVIEYTRAECLRTAVGIQIRGLPGVVCAGLRNGSADSCQGDSGGPMMYLKGGQYVLEGIVSFGNGCARRNNPGVYTSVAYYSNWVKTRLNKSRGSTPNRIDFNRWMKCIIKFDMKPCLNVEEETVEDVSTEYEVSIASEP